MLRRTAKWRHLAAAALLLVLVASVAGLRPEYRSFGGFSNSKTQPDLGAAGGAYLRRVPPRAENSIGPRGSPREISNRFGELPKRLSESGVNHLHPFFAELVAHDLVSTKKVEPKIQIPVPRCDPYFDPPRDAFGNCAGNASILFETPDPLRDAFSTPIEPKSFTNLRNAWLDLSWLYGLTTQDNAAIRTGQNGLISHSTTYNHPVRFVYDQTQWIKAGESGSINSNPVFHSFFQLFARNHNYWAEYYRNLFASEGRTITDELLFQEARAMNIAEYQNIVARQYIPATIGVPLPPYIDHKNGSAYNASENPAIELSFASAVFRYAHAEIMSFIPRIGADLKDIPAGGILLRNAFFNPMKYYVQDEEYGIYFASSNESTTGLPMKMGPAVIPTFRGLTHSPAGAVEPTLTEDMRNFVFRASPTSPGIDLISAGIQMCRTEQVGSYNDVRESLGLPRVTSFREITSYIPFQRALADVYSSPDAVDPWIGVLAEDHVGTAVVGETARRSILEQFTRIRNADRFWFENTDFFSMEEIERIHGTTLAVLLARNFPLHMNRTAAGRTSFVGSQFPTSAFFLPDRQLMTYRSSSTEDIIFFPDTPIPMEDRIDLSPIFRLSWKFHPENGTMTFIFQGRFFGWMGMGIGAEKNTMRGADIVLCRLLAPRESINASSSVPHECRDSFALDVGPPTLDTDIGGSNDILFSQAWVDSEFQTFMFIKPIDTGDAWDKPVKRNVRQGVIFAFNPDTYDLLYHGPLRSSALSVTFLPDKLNLGSIGVLDTAASAAIGVAAALGIVISASIMIMVAVKPKYFHYQETLFCQLILLGTILGYLSSFMTIAPSATRATCIANLWFMHVSYVFVVSSLFIKTWRMWRLLDVSTLQVLKITRLDMLRIVGVHILLECAILLAWTLVDPPVPTVASTTSQLIGNLGCTQTNDLWWFVTMGFKFALLGVGTFLSIKNRNHAPIFNDSREVGISTYILATTMVIVGTIGIALRQFTFVVLIVKSFGIVAPYLIISLVLFGGTCLSIFSGKEPPNRIILYHDKANSKQSEFRSDFTLSESELPEGQQRGAVDQFSLAISGNEFYPSYRDEPESSRSLASPKKRGTNKGNSRITIRKSKSTDAIKRKKKETPKTQSLSASTNTNGDDDDNNSSVSPRNVSSTSTSPAQENSDLAEVVIDSGKTKQKTKKKTKQKQQKKPAQPHALERDQRKTKQAKSVSPTYEESLSLSSSESSHMQSATPRVSPHPNLTDENTSEREADSPPYTRKSISKRNSSVSSVNSSSSDSSSDDGESEDETNGSAPHDVSLSDTTSLRW